MQKGTAKDAKSTAEGAKDGSDQKSVSGGLLQGYALKVNIAAYFSSRPLHKFFASFALNFASFAVKKK